MGFIGGYGANKIFSGALRKSAVEVGELESKVLDDGLKLAEKGGEAAAEGGEQVFKSVGAKGRNLGDIKKIGDDLLKKKGIDAHDVKREFLGDGANISRFDLYKNPDGEILIVRKKGHKIIGEPIYTGYFIDLISGHVGGYYTNENYICNFW